MSCRWKDKDGNHLYDSFILEVERPLNADGTDSPDPQPGEKRKRQPGRPTDKGALYYEYSCDVHEWLTRLDEARQLWMGHVSTLFQLDEDAPEGA